MTTIYVKYGTDQQKIEAIKSELADVARLDPNWNGVEFSIDFDDSAWIDTDDLINGARLMRSTVHKVLDA